MSSYSLINIIREYDGKVDGTWIQNCTAVSLEEATRRARATEAANSNRVRIAVVERTNSCCQDYSLRTGLKRLDV